SLVSTPAPDGLIAAEEAGLNLDGRAGSRVNATAAPIAAGAVDESRATILTAGTDGLVIDDRAGVDDERRAVAHYGDRPPERTGPRRLGDRPVAGHADVSQRDPAPLVEQPAPDLGLPVDDGEVLDRHIGPRG